MWLHERLVCFQSFNLIIYFRRIWNDVRLNYTHITQDSFVLYDKYIQRLWRPDIMFVNERDSKFHETTLPNHGVWLDPDGGIFYTSR